MNCSVRPAATLGLAGVTAIDTSEAALTVMTAAGEVLPPNAAVMFAVPAATAVTRPAELTVATLVLSDCQVAFEVTS